LHNNRFGLQFKMGMIPTMEGNKILSKVLERTLQRLMAFGSPGLGGTGVGFFHGVVDHAQR
jgi:hypothetical protein